MFNGEATEFELKDQVVSIRRVTKVVKGGKTLSFSALVVVDTQNGQVGLGLGPLLKVPASLPVAR